ncbi:unnamed protein product [Ostreobium quekettii]|uniref:Uncharacterized protein n=1 Tax=Ostreobium quekettii TaxID=121088 RepID=A0A8S1JC34_9CHLO|nr:unnamed protein product [Ostreobium quekettii]|eukprot:evm.model.scf_137.8 EVM.evm.TU.scf_137.8   scf_137:75065-78151(-)
MLPCRLAPWLRAAPHKTTPSARGRAQWLLVSGPADLLGHEPHPLGAFAPSGLRLSVLNMDLLWQAGGQHGRHLSPELCGWALARRRCGTNRKICWSVERTVPSASCGLLCGEVWGADRARRLCAGRDAVEEGLRSKKHWQDLRAAMKEIGPDLTNNHLEVIFTTARRLENAPSTSFLKEVSGVALQNLNAMEPKHLTTFLHSCAILKYVNIELIEGVVCEASRRGLEQKATPKQVGIIVYSLGALNKSHSYDVKVRFDEAVTAQHRSCLGSSDVEEFMQGLSDRIVTFLDNDELNDIQVSNVIYGLGCLKFSTDAIHRSLAALVSNPDRLQDYTARSLSTMLYGLSQVGFSDRLSLALFVKYVTVDARLWRYSEEGLSAMLYALGEFGFNDCGMLHCLMEEVTKPRRLKRFERSSLSSLCYSFRKLGFNDSKQVQPVLEEILKPQRLESLGPQVLCNIAFGLCHFGMKGNEIFWHGLATEITKEENLAGFSEQALANVALSYANLGYPSGGQLWRPLLLEATKSHRLARFTGQGLSNMLWSLRIVGFVDAKEIRALVGEVVKPTRLATASDDSLGNLLYTFARLKIVDRKCVGAVIDALIGGQKLQRADSSLLSLVVLSLGLMQYRNVDQTQILMTEVTQQHRLPMYPFTAISNMIYALGQMRLKDWTVVQRLLDEGLRHPKENHTAHGLANMIHGLALLDFKHARTISHLVGLALMEEHLKKMTAHNLTTLLLGLSRLRVSDDAVYERILERVVGLGTQARCTPEELSRVLHSLSSVGYWNDKYVVPIMDILVRAAKVQELDERSLSTLFHSLCSMRLPKDAVIRNTLRDLLLGYNMSRFSPEGLSNVLFSLGALDVRDVGIIKSIVATLTKPACLQNLNELGLVKCLHGLASIPFRNRPTVTAVVNEIKKPSRALRYSRYDRSRILDALDRLDFIDEDLLLGALVDQRVICRLSEGSLLRLISFALGCKGVDKASVRYLDKELRKPRRKYRMTKDEFQSSVQRLERLARQQHGPALDMMSSSASVP